MKPQHSGETLLFGGNLIIRLKPQYYGKHAKERARSCSQAPGAQRTLVSKGRGLGRGGGGKVVGGCNFFAVSDQKSGLKSIPKKDSTCGPKRDPKRASTCRRKGPERGLEECQGIGLTSRAEKVRFLTTVLEFSHLEHHRKGTIFEPFWSSFGISRA